MHTQYIHIYSIYKNLCIYVHKHTRTYVGCICVCMYTYIHTYVYVCIHMCKHKFLYIYMYMYVYVYTIYVSLRVCVRFVKSLRGCIIITYKERIPMKIASMNIHENAHIYVRKMGVSTSIYQPAHNK